MAHSNRIRNQNRIFGPKCGAKFSMIRKVSGLLEIGIFRFILLIFLFLYFEVLQLIISIFPLTSIVDSDVFLY